MKKIRAFSLILSILVILPGCAGLNPYHMVPYEQMGIPNESAIKSLSVSNISSTHNSGYTGIKADNSIEVKEAFISTLRSYRLLDSSSNKTVSASFNVKNLTDWGDFTSICEATYSISDNDQPVEVIDITTEYTAKLNHSEMWKQALVAGIAAGVATNVKINTGSTSKAIGSGVAAGLLTAAVIDPESQQVAKSDDMPEPGLSLTNAQLEQLDIIAYAREGTPLTALDGTKRMQIAMESSIRKNLAMFVKKILDGEIKL
jgi:hypothetical protein